MARFFLFMSFALTHFSVLHQSAEGTCSSYFCNDEIGAIYYPFKFKDDPPECGLFSVNCSDRSHPKIQLKDGGNWYEFTDISQLNMVSMINDKEIQERIENCTVDDGLNNFSFPSPSPVSNVSSTHNLTLFKCNHALDPTIYGDHIPCRSSSYYYTHYNLPAARLPNPTPQCPMLQLPLPPHESSDKFTIQVTVAEECYECYKEERVCMADKGEPICSGQGIKLSLKVGLAGGVGGAAGLVVLVMAIYCFLRRNHGLRHQFSLGRSRTKSQNLEAFLVKYGPLQVKRYSYLGVKKMTNSFAEKLGQGGYGGVYKGKLKDGSLVAVKVLNRSKGNGEEFMNEVATISRTSHVNVVSLLGFCFEGPKRALIYEFMPNGSLEKFIFDANNPQKDHQLGWEALDRISKGIARGLEYLHRGCNTRILHFDIKPHNILLDENFSPKISDFGLAKICDRKESIVSMLGARGTVGYIAPEVFCRNFGGVSHKSDVYSFGMMLSEMVGGRKNIDAEAENSSEIYFPHWIYKRLELDQELGLQSIMNEEDKERARKMIIVSLWCIQTDPSNRPSIKQVIEMLEGSVESLQIPPKPYLSSPKSHAVTDSSTTLVSVQ